MWYAVLIMDLYLFIILFSAKTTVVLTSTETNKITLSHDLCVVYGGCSEINEQNITTATKIKFEIIISAKSVEVFGEEHILKGLQEYMQQNFDLNPKDVFQFVLSPGVNERLTHVVSFILQPYTPNVDMLIKFIFWMTETAEIKTLGFPLQFPENTFVTETVTWDSVKTIVSFALDVEYAWLSKFSIHASMTEIVTTLSERTQLDKFDIHDLLIFQNDVGNTTVLFALPPVMSKERSEVLENIKAFVEKPCERECKQSDSAVSKKECKTCQYFDLFGVSIYPDPQSFRSRYETWKGHVHFKPHISDYIILDSWEKNLVHLIRTIYKDIRNETRFKANEGVVNPCPDHMELCSRGKNGPKCVGIGRCDLNFYKPILLILEVYGSIQLLDIYGTDYSEQVVKDSLTVLHDLCASAVKLDFLGKGRATFEIHVIIDPYLGRDKGIESIDEMVMSNNEIEISNLVIRKVDGSYRKEYFDLNRSTPKYLESECFGCARDEIWCLLPNISLCMSKNPCIDQYYENFKLAEDTEIVRFNLLMISDEEFEVVDEIVRNDIRIQISEQLTCSVELLSDVNLAESEEKGYIELGFVVTSLYDKITLQKTAINVHRVTDKGILYIITRTAVYYAVPDTVLFRQYISGYPKLSQTEIISADLGNSITGISCIVFVSIALPIAVACKKQRQSKSKMKLYYDSPEAIHTYEEKKYRRHRHIETFMMR